MLSRDLTATVIKTFFEELEDVREGGNGPDRKSRYNKVYKAYFERDRDWFINTGIEDMSKALADEPVYKLEMLAELMYQDASLEGNEEWQVAMFRKILGFYDIIDIRSQEFSVARMNRTMELKKRIED